MAEVLIRFLRRECGHPQGAEVSMDAAQAAKFVEAHKVAEYVGISGVIEQTATVLAYTDEYVEVKPKVKRGGRG